MKKILYKIYIIHLKFEVVSIYLLYSFLKDLTQF